MISLSGKERDSDTASGGCSERARTREQVEVQVPNAPRNDAEVRRTDYRDTRIEKLGFQEQNSTDEQGREGGPAR